MPELSLEGGQKSERVADKMIFFGKKLTPPPPQTAEWKTQFGVSEKKNQNLTFFANHTTIIRSKIELAFFENRSVRWANLFRPVL